MTAISKNNLCGRMLQGDLYPDDLSGCRTDPRLRRGDGESVPAWPSGAFRLEDAVSLDAIDAYSHRTYKENGRYTLTPIGGRACGDRKAGTADGYAAHISVRRFWSRSLRGSLPTAGISPCGNARSQRIHATAIENRNLKFDRNTAAHIKCMKKIRRCRTAAAFGRGILPSPV